MWAVDNARNWAIFYLERSSIGNAEKLYLGVTYHINHWIRPAFFSLLTTPLPIIRNQVPILGMEIFVVLMCAKDAVDTERRLLCLAPPLIHDPPYHPCASREICEKIWKEIWSKKVTKRLLHPNEPILVESLPTYIGGLTLKGMSPECQLAATQILTVGNGLQGEQRAVNATIVAIVP